MSTPYIPTFDEFKASISEIYGSGNLKKGYDLVYDDIEKRVTQEGDPVTWDYILSQYKAHIKWWDHHYKALENRRRLSEDAINKRLDILTFMNKDAYNWNWSFTSRSLDSSNEYFFYSIPTRILICMSDKNQNMLGSNREDVLKMIKDSPILTLIEKNIAEKGTPPIHATYTDGTIIEFYFKDGLVYLYELLIDPININANIKFMNDNYIKDDDNRWSDYSTGTRVYYLLEKSDDLFVIHASRNYRALKGSI